MINIVCWKWVHPTYRTRYTAEHVNMLYAMLKKYCRRPFRLICVTDDATDVQCETFPLWGDLAEMQNPNGFNLPCCYRRLKLFSRETQREMRIHPGDSVVSFDLDVVIVDEISGLFDRDVPFIAWKGKGAFQPHVYNGSLWMFKAGELEWMWTEFDPIKSPRETRAARFFGSDQGWLSFRLATENSPGWNDKDGVYSYSRDVRMRVLPHKARIVFFNGKHKPWDEVTCRQTPWVARHWRRRDAVSKELRAT